jgi:transcription elongation factor SPT5
LAPRFHHFRLGDERQWADLAQNLRQRYRGPTSRPESVFPRFPDDTPQSLLVPNVDDAPIFSIHVKVSPRPVDCIDTETTSSFTQRGTEHATVFEILRRASLPISSFPILSAFTRDSLRGRIYVEAKSESDVKHALKGIYSMDLSRGLQLVSIDDRVRALSLRDLDTAITRGTWVRPKWGKYKGDLGLVLSVDNCFAEVALVPRLLTFQPDKHDGQSKGKRKGPLQSRPPQCLFNPKDVADVYGSDAVKKRNMVYVFCGEIYKNGMLEKSFDLSSLNSQNVNAATEEMMRFRLDEYPTFRGIGTVVAQNAAALLSMGDKVEILSGQQKGLRGMLGDIEGENVLVRCGYIGNKAGSITAPSVVIHGEAVRKYFLKGDHVIVRAGMETGRSGMVIECEEGVVTFFDASSSTHVRPFQAPERYISSLNAR